MLPKSAPQAFSWLFYAVFSSRRANSSLLHHGESGMNPFHKALLWAQCLTGSPPQAPKMENGAGRSEFRGKPGEWIPIRAGGCAAAPRVD
jgi:hypothetical protein